MFVHWRVNHLVLHPPFPFPPDRASYLDRIKISKEDFNPTFLANYFHRRITHFITVPNPPAVRHNTFSTPARSGNHARGNPKDFNLRIFFEIGLLAARASGLLRPPIHSRNIRLFATTKIIRLIEIFWWMFFIKGGSTWIEESFERSIWSYEFNLRIFFG